MNARGGIKEDGGNIEALIVECVSVLSVFRH